MVLSYFGAINILMRTNTVRACGAGA